MIMLNNMIVGEKKLSIFLKIHERYEQTMYSVAINISKNSYDAEDIVANAFIKVIYILNEIDPKEVETQRVKNLIITITKNAAIDYLRKNRRIVASVIDLEIESGEKSVEELCVEAEDYQRLLGCIDKLDDKYRDVLRLRVLNNLSSKSIGKILNISEASVNMRFMRAKHLLVKRLKESE